MDKEEFEKELIDFEKNVRKKLPSMINMNMASRGSRESQANFNYFIESLRRSRTAITRELEKYARPAQRMRFFNTLNTMESLLRSMYGRSSIQERLRQKRADQEKMLTQEVRYSDPAADVAKDKIDRDMSRIIDSKPEKK